MPTDPPTNFVANLRHMLQAIVTVLAVINPAVCGSIFLTLTPKLAPVASALIVSFAIACLACWFGWHRHVFATGDVIERAKLNSFRFIAVNIAQFIVGGFTLTLVAKFAGADQNKQRGWAITMGIWALLCLVLFLITFFTTKERIAPESSAQASPRQDFADLLGFLRSRDLHVEQP
jgi:cyanate permease